MLTGVLKGEIISVERSIIRERALHVVETCCAGIEEAMMKRKMKNNGIQFTGMRSGKKLTPLLIALLYTAVGGIWILTSDSIVFMISRDPDIITRLQTYKGWFYVAITGSMLFWLIHRYGNKLMRAMDILSESEERYRIVVETALDAIITINAESTIVFANPAVERILGYSNAEIAGRKLDMLMPERFRQRHYDGIKRYRETGKRRVSWQNVEFPGLHKSGREIPL